MCTESDGSACYVADFFCPKICFECAEKDAKTGCVDICLNNCRIAPQLQFPAPKILKYQSSGARDTSPLQIAG